MACEDGEQDECHRQGEVVDRGRQLHQTVTPPAAPPRRPGGWGRRRFRRSRRFGADARRLAGEPGAFGHARGRGRGRLPLGRRARKYQCR
jgi:hypothetical protein